MSCKQEKYVVSLYHNLITDPNLKLDRSGGFSSMSVSVCPPVVLLVSIGVIPLMPSGQCRPTAEELHQFAVLVCHRKNNRSLSSFFPIFIPLNLSNGFVVPFSLFSFYTDWKLKATSDPKPARLILSKCTQRHILTW